MLREAIVIGDIHLPNVRLNDFIDELLVFNKHKKYKKIIFLGDILTNRDMLSINVYYDLNNLLNRIKNEFEEIIVIKGNHDVSTKNRSFLSMVENICGIDLISKPTIKYDCLFLPYYSTKSSISDYKNVDFQFVFAHLFEGFSNDLVDKFDCLNYWKMTISGHVHNFYEEKNEYGNHLIYLGNTTTSTFGEIPDKFFIEVDSVGKRHLHKIKSNNKFITCDFGDVDYEKYKNSIESDVNLRVRCLSLDQMVVVKNEVKCNYKVVMVENVSKNMNDLQSINETITLNSIIDTLLENNITNKLTKEYVKGLMI